MPYGHVPADQYVPAAEYAHRLGLTEAPDWLPDLIPSYLEIVEKFDATRVDGRYGEESLEFARSLDAWGDRSAVVLWALFRALLRQPGGSALFRRDIVEGLRWSGADALWLVPLIPARKSTSHLLLATLESVSPYDLPLAAADVARLREVVTDPEYIERITRLENLIAKAPRVEDLFDPLFAERIGPVLNLPIRELLDRCALPRLGRPSWWWRDLQKRRLANHWDALKYILACIPPHLEEHGGFSKGEDTLRGLMYVAEASDKGWITPLFADIVLAAAGGPGPVRSLKLANTAVDALYYRPKSKGVLTGLRGKVRHKTVLNLIDRALKYM
ncbi:hypothetical protein AB0I28_07780 [Phytomonospora sp. NPDC050363]|uniref:hypothetical protein n=1 Tax=Phytomonospora sp. NPDC050363 TaxID=3155642 RepID=UPI0033C99BD1